MPNHVTNHLLIDCDDSTLEKILSTIKGKGRLIDFDKIIPMPETEEDNWYRWSINNWGTKWNAYEQRMVYDNVIEFCTAWNHPAPVISKISKMFPDVEFEVLYADEDIGHNLDHYTIKNGDRIKGYVIKDPFDFAARLVYGKTGEELKKAWGEED